MEELRKKEIETIIELLRAGLLGTDSSLRFGQFLVNAVFGRSDPFYLDNKEVIKRLNNHIEQSKNNIK